MIIKMQLKFSKIFNLAFCLTLLLSINLLGQISWQRDETAPDLPLQLFHSTHAIILPTAETLQRGDFEFEVSHRFIPTIHDGPEELYGFDGPANIKLGLSYGLSDDFLLGVSRSNVNDNLELIAKFRAIEYDNELIPIVLGLRGAAVWNTDPTGRTAKDNRNFQYYAQLIVNTMIEKKLGIGVVPSFLYNSDIYYTSKKSTFTLGLNLQYYLSSWFSLLAEWNPTIAGLSNKYDSFSFGFELETGGHFFKIIFTNNTLLNTSQYLGGSADDIVAKNYRVGFNITRLLKF